MSNISKATLATLLYVIGIELVGSWYYVAEFIEYGNCHNYYLLIQGALQFIVVVAFIYFIKHWTLENIIKKTNHKWYLLGVILGISFVFLQSPLNWVYNFSFGTDYHIIYRFDGLPKFKNINFISSIFLIPIAEELFFRGYIQRGLQKSINVYSAIIIASFLFALIHSPYSNLFLDSSNQDGYLFYLTMFGGIISGILYFKSNSVGPSFIFHIFWNLMAIIV